MSYFWPHRTAAASASGHAGELQKGVCPCGASPRTVPVKTTTRPLPKFPPTSNGSRVLPEASAVASSFAFTMWRYITTEDESHDVLLNPSDLSTAPNCTGCLHSCT